MKQSRAPTAMVWQYLKTEFITETAAAALLALGICVFSAPNRIVGGGLSGIASVLFILFGLPIGTVSLALNIPLLLLGWRKLGHRFILRTLRITVIMSVIMDATTALVPPYTGELLLAAVFGGVFTGAGLGIILMHGDSTGGTDIIVMLIKKKYPHLSFGFIVLITDCAVVLMAAIAYRSMDTILYGTVMIYASTVVIDRIIDGADARKLVLIITHEEQAVTQSLLSGLGRGVTVLSAQGGYSRAQISVLLCVVDKRQIFQLKALVRKNDGSAFVIIAHATETLGTGFKQLLD
ncbi:MAG: YitT family protein [Candidatus Fimivivens sp.]|nr:YitT family protein [Candidatus Fimivivens sp.]